MAGLLNGANTYLTGLSNKSCTQAVVLVTDGLPTRDLAGKNWPPLGSIAAVNYGVTATFNADGSLASTNNQALTDTIAALTSLRNAGIKTHIIGLGAGVVNAANPVAAQTLRAMAIAGGTTNFFPATDPATLTTAFNTIVDGIYRESSIAAPIVPISVKSGNQFEISLTSDPFPRAGFAKAYAVDANAVPAATPSWDAAALMTTALRTPALLSTTTTNTITTLGNIDAAAFNLTATTCIPDVATIVAYTLDPSYSAISGCSYLGDRKSGWFLGSFSTQSVGKYVGAASSAALSTTTGFSSYAGNVAARPAMIMFSNNDGFIYAVNPTTGALLWAWAPRSALAQFQNYATYQTMGLLDGNFAVVDAQDSGGTWASYLVGSARSGAEHYSLKLNNSGVPTNQIYSINVASGTSPGDKAGVTGATPLHQKPQFVYIGGKTYAVFVVNSGSTSTLYQVNVANASDQSSAALPFTLSSAIYVDPERRRLWAGSAAGGVWMTTLTASSSADVARMAQVGSTINPANNSSAVTPILYVGYNEVNGAPYFYAVNASQITVYGIGASGYTPLWATTTTSAYRYAGGSFVATQNAPALIANSIVSDSIRVDGVKLVLPLFVPPSGGCGTGTAYYQFISLADGTTLSATVTVGSGIAYEPPITMTQSTGSTAYVPGSSEPAVRNPIPVSSKLISPVSWKQR